jgi:DNA-binding SARP family transcriptional activator
LPATGSAWASALAEPADPAGPVPPGPAALAGDPPAAPAHAPSTPYPAPASLAPPVPQTASGPAASTPGASTPTAGPSPVTALRIGILGTFTINGAAGALLPAQSQLILALALNGAVGLSNPQLGYLLGADPDHPKPSDSLRQLITRTRRQLGPGPAGREWIVHLGGGQYALHPDARFDWAEFSVLAERGLAGRNPADLRAALSLVRGQPFTGCYQWWLDLAFVETVRAQIVDTADLLAGLELAAGNPSASARAARAGLAGDVAAEQLWRALMRAEHATGNLSGVREAWTHCLAVIADIAPDGEPHPDTAELYRELLRHAPGR